MDSGFAERARRLLPGVWFGLLLCVALIATRAPFAVLERPQAGLVVAHVFAHEAPASIVLGGALLVLARRRAAQRAEQGAGSQFSGEMILALGAIACTVVGYYVLQPLMADAKAGLPGAASFGVLHGVSLGLFGLKSVLVGVLAWQAAGASAQA